MRPQGSHNAALFFQALIPEQFEFETPGVWLICAIKKTLQMDFFSTEV